jgi:hypothetical protein
MTMNPRYRSALGARAAIALCGLLFVAGPAWSANTAIYKCFDKNLGLLYTDLPCKDGEALDLRPGDADPASVARLERERDQLDQSAAQRILDERRAAAQRDLAYGMRGEAIYDRGVPDYADSSLDYGYGYPLFAYPVHAHPRPRRLHPARIAEPPRFAPNPPYIVPRQ